MLEKIKAFFNSSLFSVVVLLAVVAYYIFRLKRWPSIEEAFVQTSLILVRLGTLIESAQKVVVPKPPAPPAPGVALALLLALGASLALSCAHQPAITDGLEHVGKECALGVVPDLLPAIESAAAAGTKEAALAEFEKLAGATAWCLVSQAGAAVLDELTTRHASSEPGALRKAQNLRAMLEQHPVQ